MGETATAWLIRDFVCSEMHLEMRYSSWDDHVSSTAHAE